VTDPAVSAKEVARWIAALGSAALGTLAIGLLAPWMPLPVEDATWAAMLSFAVAFAWVSTETLVVGALTPALGPRSSWVFALLAFSLVAVASLGPAPSVAATSAVALLLLGAGSSLGAIVGRRVEHAGYLGVVAYVSSIADLTSVLHESGPSAQILESAPTLAVLAVGAPMLGTADVSPILGVGDVIFVALYLAAAARHRLPWRRTLVALSLALAVTFAVLLLLAQPIPALPFLGLAMVLAHRETWLPPARERRQALAGVVVATLVVAVVWLR